MNIRMKPPMTFEPVGERVRVVAGGSVVADSEDAIYLNERGRSPVVYVPLRDVKAGVLEPTDHSSQCHLKGAANYFSLRLDDGRVLENAVWQYANPKDGAEELADLVAFYAHLIDDVRIGD